MASKNKEPQFDLWFDLMKELNSGVAINKHSLDDDNEAQPELFRRVANLTAQAKSDVEEIKREIDIAEDELYVQFRTNEAEENSDEEKRSKGMSENHIKAKIGATPRVVKLIRQLSVAERKLNELQALKESYIQRGHSIRGEIDLYHDEYWQRESGGKRRTDAVDRAAKRNIEEAGEMRTRMSRHKRKESDDDD